MPTSSLCGGASHLDRDQRHLLPDPGAGELRQVARRDARRFRLRGEGPPRRGQQEEAREAGEAVEWFFKSGVTELGPKLGPLLWQLAPYKKFEPDDIEAFLALLPRQAGGRDLKHVLEVRHASFLVPEFVALMRKHEAAIVYADSDEYPAIADVTAPFAYLRLQRTAEDIATGYSRRPTSTSGRSGRSSLPPAASRTTCRASATDSGEEEARRLRLHDLRRQGPGAGRGDGADRAGEVGRLIGSR